MGNTEEYQIKTLNEYRSKKILSILPFIMVNGYDTDFIWTGKWCKYITIKQEKVKERYLQFDDGWSYQNYWSEWRNSWKFLKIVN